MSAVFMFISRSKRWICIVFLWTGWCWANAETVSPESYAQELVAYLQSDLHDMKQNPQHTLQFFGNWISPHLDIDALITGMSGRSTLVTLTESQRLRLYSAVRVQMIRYLFEALDEYTEQQIQFAGRPSVDRLRFVIQRKLLPDIAFEVILGKLPDDWRVVDFSVAGISYAHMKRAQYQVIIMASGMEGLISHLEDKNLKYFTEKGLNLATLSG